MSNNGTVLDDDVGNRFKRSKEDVRQIKNRQIETLYAKQNRRTKRGQNYTRI